MEHGEVSGTVKDHGLGLPNVELKSIFCDPIKHNLRFALHDYNAFINFRKGKMTIKLCIMHIACMRHHDV